VTVHFMVYFEPALAPEGMTPEHFQSMAEEAVDAHLRNGLLRLNAPTRRELRKLINWTLFFEEALRGPLTEACPALAGPDLQFVSWSISPEDDPDPDWATAVRWVRALRPVQVRLVFSRTLP